MVKFTIKSYRIVRSAVPKLDAILSSMLGVIGQLRQNLRKGAVHCRKAEIQIGERISF